MLNRLPKFADGYTYALAMNEAMKNDGLSPMYDQTQLDGIKNNDPHYGNVNWMDEVLSKSGSTDNVFVTLSGGGKLSDTSLLWIISPTKVSLSRRILLMSIPPNLSIRS